MTETNVVGHLIRLSQRYRSFKYLTHTHTARRFYGDTNTEGEIPVFLYSLPVSVQSPLLVDFEPITLSL